MSSLEQNIDSLTNEDIVNSLIEEFQNDISLKEESLSQDSNVLTENESKTSVQQGKLFSKESKIIELDDSESEDKKIINKSLLESNHPLDEESAPNSKMCEENRDVHQDVSLTEMDEKDGEPEDCSLNDEENEEYCGVDDSGLSQDEIKVSENLACLHRS